MKENSLYVIVLGFILAFVLFLHAYKIEPFETFSLRFNDINFELQNKEPSHDVVFVAVDERSVNEFGRWPWSRDVLAKGVEKLNKADVVLMDMIFSEPTTLEQDTKLSDAISSLNNSVCGFFLRDKATQKIGDKELEILGDSSLDLLQSKINEHKKPTFIGASFAEMNILPIMSACSLSGSFSTLSESDHLLRAYPLSVYFQEKLYPSLGVQGLRLKFNKDLNRVDDAHVEINGRDIALDDRGFTRLNFYRAEQYKIVSFLDVVKGMVKPEYFNGKIVILGITEVGAGDVVSTPMGQMAGPLLHYTFISNLLQNHLIEEPKIATSVLIIFMTILPFVSLLIFKKIVYRTALNIVVYLIVYVVIRYLFISNMIYIDLFYPLVSLVLSLIGAEAIAFNIQEKRDKFLKGAFSSYLSADLLEKLIKNPSSLSLGGEAKELSILFSDIRGFTTISESMQPVALIKLLNRYFTPMTNAVLENSGMLDKYIGDAVMAFFNAPVDVKNHADASCRCALEMIERLHVLNKELALEGIAPIKIGIGINSAEVVVGNMGSDSRFNYTVIGDGVNLASRVEGLTKNYGVDILLTEFCIEKLNSKFVYREIEPVKVKGKDRAVLLYELMPDTPLSKEIKQIYDEALQNYKKSNYKDAAKLFSELAERYNDGPSKYFLPLAVEEHAWGVHKMDTK